MLSNGNGYSLSEEAALIVSIADYFHCVSRERRWCPRARRELPKLTKANGVRVAAGASAVAAEKPFRGWFLSMLGIALAGLKRYSIRNQRRTDCAETQPSFSKRQRSIFVLVRSLVWKALVGDAALRGQQQHQSRDNDPGHYYSSHFFSTETQ
jgi:hypothetical protein